MYKRYSIYLPTILQDCVFHNITKHFNGSTEAINAKPSSSVKSLILTKSQIHKNIQLYAKTSPRKIRVTCSHLLQLYQKLHPNTILDLDPCTGFPETVETFGMISHFQLSSAWEQKCFQLIFMIIQRTSCFLFSKSNMSQRNQLTDTGREILLMWTNRTWESRSTKYYQAFKVLFLGRAVAT